MATDYVLFIHGVNVRSEAGFKEDATRMFERIKAVASGNRQLKLVTLYWGDVSKSSLKSLRQGLAGSNAWQKIWFREFRETQVLSFVGDAALYLSRDVSVQIVKRITEQALSQMGINLEEMKHPDPGDRVHLVTHSWGTVILFDVMFAPRWEDNDLAEEVRQSVQNIRTGLFGVGDPSIQQLGIPIASIHTMGSPIALFSLIQAQGAQSFNLTPNLKEFLEAIFRRQGKELPWQNFVHPGDPIAYPLEGIKSMLLNNAEQFVQLEDILLSTSWISRPFQQSLTSILNGGNAHGSYWGRTEVAEQIGRII